LDELDKKLNEVFEGRVVRKDLLHRIKKGTNVPTFVLEFLLARYCASNEPEEIQAGMEAVLATLQDNYVRPDEANAAQSKVAMSGKHRFIDKIHVTYVEKEKRHWAELENFNSRRVAIAERFYKDIDRLLEGGIWAEVTVAHNEIEDDDYAFYVEDLRPIQISRFDFGSLVEGREAFTRDEWLDVILRSVGLEPGKLSKRQRFHYVARLAPLAEANYNFIELGPRGTGKSYFFSEFTPYSTLISGGQATKATLFYNMAKKKLGLVSYWDTVAFDEVGNIKIRDADAIQIMKDYMANGRFSRGTEVIADASLAFVGNIDQSIEQVVASNEFDLFLPLPKEFDLAVMDRFSCYVPGWEMPKNSSEFLTDHFGFITDYLAEAFHYQGGHANRYEEVSQHVKLGTSVEGRDENAIKKTLCAFLKILHPGTVPSEEEFEEYVAYAIEGRRRIKEQMNKRKPDDEFANINLSYINHVDEEVIVFCPESKQANATQKPNRPGEQTPEKEELKPEAPSLFEPSEESEPKSAQEVPAEELEEKHFTIFYGDTGHSYESIIAPYLPGVKRVKVDDAYIRKSHQIGNFVRLCETLLRHGSINAIELKTGFDDDEQRKDTADKLGDLAQSLLENDIVLGIEFDENLHDREITLDNGWVIKIGRGLDFYQPPRSWFDVGANDLSLRPCLETKVDIYRG
jgi:ATP-dependent Lon protease